MTQPIDYVVTFVDGNDPNWRSLYKKRMHGLEPSISLRFRDYGTLRYAFRGIEKFMPWINNVILIVQQESQIPKWINRNCNKLRIVFHEDYIPKEFLPTFNSNVIELFINRIKDLSNYFILANDDMLPCGPLSPDEFFFDGMVVDNPKFEDFSKSDGTSIFSYIKRNSNELAAKVAKKNTVYIRNYHLLLPHIKETWNKVWNEAEKDLLSSIRNSPKRTRINVNHWVFRYYSILLNNFHKGKNNGSGYVDISSPGSLVRAEYLLTHSNMVCFNDHLENENQLEELENIMRNHFPKKSIFEV